VLREIKESWESILLISFLILVSRIPFIYNSPGFDLDNWRVLWTGKYIHTHGRYIASRFPGYPVSEYIASFVYDVPYYIFNLITVIFSVLCSIIFFLILKKLRYKESLLAAITFSFIQTIVINSMVSMDYMWSLFFMLLATYAILENKFSVTGLLLGLMVVIRFTSICFIPAFFYLIYKMSNKKINVLIKLSFILFITIFVAFTPVFRTYGLNIFPRLSIWKFEPKKIFSFLTLYNFGFLGTITLGISIVIMIWSIVKKVKIDIQNHNPLKIFSVIIIFLNIIIIIRYPFENAYLIPMIPFLLLLICVTWENKIMKRILFISLIISPYLFHVSSMSFKLKGEVFVNEDLEDSMINYTRKLNDRIKNIDGKKLIILGNSFFVYQIMFQNNKFENTIFVNHPKESYVQDKIKNGYKVYFTSSAIENVNEFYNYDIRTYGQQIIDEIKLDR